MNMVFAICAIGERYKRYRDNLVKSLNKYVPEIDVVEIDTVIAAKSLPGVPKEDLPTMSRLAIPIMDEFAKYDRVVWVDVDVDIISSKFANILKVETSDDGLAAVADVNQHVHSAYMKTRFNGYDKPTYFNVGVVVMDLWKIDRNAWRNKISEALAVHVINPFRWRDQDILNGYFDINEIDKRFNFLWINGVDPQEGAYLIHYAVSSGNSGLDEILAIRSDMPANKSRDRCVVISPRHDFIRPWIRAYFASGNTIPLVIVRVPSCEWTEEDLEYCKSAAESCGGFVADVATKWVDDSCSGQYKVSVLRYVSEHIAPKTWAWIDDDVEVVGNIDDCFDYVDRATGFVCAQFRYSGIVPDAIDVRHHQEFDIGCNKFRDFCWTSLLFFHGNANVELTKSLIGKDCSDDKIFGCLYNDDPVWHDGFCDLSIRNWQLNCMKKSDIPQHVNCKFIHYSGAGTDGSIKLEWSRKFDSLPRAPFEGNDTKRICNMSHMEEDGPIDAVFIIGTGSLNGNEELRYALRNLDKHCKFVRNVYICGVCPSWVDKTVVRHLQWPDRFNHAKDANIIDKLRHACEVNGIAKRILFCSDDQFQTRECSWDDFRPRYLRRYASNDTWYEKRHRVWHSRLRNTLEREVQRRKALGIEANDVFYYQPHIWMPIDRDRFIAYAKWCNYERRDDTIIASGYFNFVDADGFPDQDNPVTFLDGNIKEVPETVHVAYHDGSYKNAMSMLKQMFPERSRFELAPRSIKPFGLVTSIAESESGNAMQTKRGEDPSPATQDETAQILGVMSRIRQNPAWHGMLHEVSRAEELRLFGVKGWRIVWDDIVERWKTDTDNGQNPVVVRTSRSEKASAILDAYASSPQSMRTVSFGPAANLSRQLPRPEPDKIVLRNRVHAALRRSAK